MAEHIGPLDDVVKEAEAHAQTYKCHVQEYDAGKKGSSEENLQSADVVLDLPRKRV